MAYAYTDMLSVDVIWNPQVTKVSVEAGKNKLWILTKLTTPGVIDIEVSKPVCGFEMYALQFLGPTSINAISMI